MKNFFLFFISLLIFSCCHLSQEEKQIPKKFNRGVNCQEAKNLWGFSKKCDCEERLFVYEERLGVCLSSQLSSEQQEFFGVLSNNIFAIGGETTGFTLTVGRENYDLYLKDSDKNLLKNSNRKKIKIKGIFFIKEGVEIKETRSLLVESVSFL